ncbi:hypothetical protein [Paludisphaera rhizosphaerae]|uniref:hypothetical protein n=1 Tax=Paludisphaera rhizosphaerae TaxID=2711216 RepID=UPI0013E9E7AE|nr:hypothetical protein [Paludisphaera rhizosphaerae]
MAKSLTTLLRALDAAAITVLVVVAALEYPLVLLVVGVLLALWWSDRGGHIDSLGHPARATLSTTQGVLVAAVIGLVAVVASKPYHLAFLACGALLAARPLRVGAGIGRIAPAVVLAAIVVAAYYAPVKTIERKKAQLIALPKLEMAVAELRSPWEFGLDRPSPVSSGSAFIYMIGEDPQGRIDDQLVRFPSQRLTMEQFIQAIEGQTPLQHWFASCGNAGSSILFGRNCAMGLAFSMPRP